MEKHLILLPVHKDFFCSKLNCLPVIRKFLGQKWQNHNFGDKTVLQNLFSLDFSLHVIVGCIKPRIQLKSLKFWGREIFMSV